MHVADILSALEKTSLASAVRGDSGWEWLFPIVEVFHVIFLAVVFGSITMVDVRLLGFGARRTPISRLSADVLPWTWMAFVLAAATGFLLFISKAQSYFYNTHFQLKFLCMGLAGINMLIFNLMTLRRIGEEELAARTPPAVRLAGAVSLVCWIGVVFFGRWVGWGS